MKKLLLIIGLIFSVSVAYAQSFSYQATARDIGGDLLVNTNLGVQVNILSETATGTTVFSETFSTSTNMNGVFSLAIGEGANVSGTLSGLNWGITDYYLQIAVDDAGGTNYAVVGVSQIRTTPVSMTSLRFEDRVGNTDVIQLAQTVVNNTSNITTLQNSDANQESRILILENQNLDARLTAAEAAIAQNSTDIASGNTALQLSIDANATAIATLQSDVDTNESDADAAIAAVQSDVDANETASNDADTTLQSNIDAVQSDVDANESDSDAADTTLQNNINTVQSDVDTNESDADAAIAGVQSDVDANESDADAAIAGVQSDVDANESDADAAIAINTSDIAVLNDDADVPGSVLNIIDTVTGDVIIDYVPFSNTPLSLIGTGKVDSDKIKDGDITKEDLNLTDVASGLDGAGLATESEVTTEVTTKINSSIVSGTDDDPNVSLIPTDGKTIYIDSDATTGTPKVWVNAGGIWVLIANAL